MLGRYEVLAGLGHGGMATVYLARTAAEAGFRRLVAIKVLHPHLSEDAAFVAMLLDEARIAARLHHPNVVPIVDVGDEDGLHFVVMEYVEGTSLFALLAKNRDGRPPRLVVPIVLDALAGLHAAHELRGDDDQPLQLVHRDVSPHNVLVGLEGTARITDFGVARAEARIGSTRPGDRTKGKVGFLSPEQLRGAAINRRADVFAAGVMLWSSLTGKRLFYDPESEAATTEKTLHMEIPKPSTVGLRPPAAFDDVCLRALERDPDARFATALDMEDALRKAASDAGLVGTRQEVADWMARTFGEELATRREAVRAARPSQRTRTMPEVGALGAGEDDTPPTIAAIAPPPRSRKWIVVALAAALVFGAIGAIGVATRAPPTSAAPPRESPKPAAAVTVAATVTAMATVTATAAATTTATAAGTAPRRRAATRPTPSAPPSASQRWDRDSPLPPP